MGSDSTPTSQLLTLISSCRKVGLCPARPAGNSEEAPGGQRPCTHLSARSCCALAMAVSPGEGWRRVSRPGPGPGHLSLPSSYPVSRLWSQESPGAASGEAPAKLLSALEEAPPPGPLGLACGPYFLFPTLQLYHNWGSTHSLTLDVWGTLIWGGIGDFFSVSSWCQILAGHQKPVHQRLGLSADSATRGAYILGGSLHIH